jgi:hypothetical protein
MMYLNGMKNGVNFEVNFNEVHFENVVDVVVNVADSSMFGDVAKAVSHGGDP